MALINNATREITAKIVYYGPGLCGKTTNLKYIYDTLPVDRKGKMISLATETDRTLFFDFLPIELGRIKDFKTRVQLYTVPGQVFYDATRKLVLQGVDGVVFVADSQVEMLQSNEESLENLRVNLAEKKVSMEEIPLVLQYNKRDLPNVLPIGELNRRLNPLERPYFEASALRGDGVHETFQGACRQVLESLGAKFVALEREAIAAPLRRLSPTQDREEPQPAQAPPPVVPPDAAVLEEGEVFEPSAARAMTERALEAAQGPPVDQAFPMEDEEAPPRRAPSSVIEEDFISLSDLEEIADLHDIVGGKEPVEPPPAEASAAEKTVTMQRPPDLDGAESGVSRFLEEQEPEIVEAVAEAAEPAIAADHVLEAAAAEPPALRAQPASGGGVDIVVPVDLSTLGIDQTPDGLEVRFTIKLIFRK